MPTPVSTEALAVAIQANVPSIAWGSPGTAKTSIIHALAKRLERPMHVFVGAYHEAQDLGWPVLDDIPVRKKVVSQHRHQNVDKNKKVYQHLISQAKMLTKVAPKWALDICQHGDGIVFLDEFSNTEPAVQAVMLQLLFEGKLGDLQFPKSVSFVAAANAVSEAANGFNLSLPLKNRLVHIDWTIDVDTWVQGVLSDFPSTEFPILPSNWKTHLNSQKPLVATFIHAKRDMLLQMPKSASENAYPTPRSWHHLAMPLLAACKSLGKTESDDLTVVLLDGCVGKAAGNEFRNYVRSLDLPDPEMLLANPSEWSIWAKGKRGDQVIAALTSMASAAMGNNTKSRWESAWEIVITAAKGGYKPSALLAGNQLSLKKPEGAIWPPIEEVFGKMNNLAKGKS